MERSELRSFQSLGLQQWPGSLRDKRQQILGTGRVLRAREHPGRKDRDLLQWIGQRSYDLDAGDRHQLADLLDADLSLAPGNDLADGSAALRNDELRLHGVADAELCEHGRKIDAALAGF